MIGSQNKKRLLIIIMNVLKVVIIVHNINMNIMENVMKIVQMDFYMIIMVIRLINVNAN